MNNTEDDELMSIAQVLLSIGHSYVCGLDEEVSEQEQEVEGEEKLKGVGEVVEVKDVEGEEKGGEEMEKEEKSQILYNERVKNFKNEIQTEMTNDIEENMQQESSEKQEELEKKKIDHSYLCGLDKEVSEQYQEVKGEDKVKDVKEVEDVEEVKGVEEVEELQGVEEVEGVEGEEKGGEEIEKEEKSRILNKKRLKNVKNEIQTEITMDIEENMEQESIEIQEKFKKIKIDIEGNRQLELKDKMKNEDEGKKSSKSNNDIQTESNKNVQNEGNKEKYEVKKEVVNECEEVVLLNNEVVIEVKKEFNNEIYLKSESYKKLDTEMLVDPTFLQESHGIVQEKQQKTEKDSEIGLNIGIKINLVSQNKLDVIVKKEFIENQQIFENLTDVQLMIQVDNSELQQELDREVQEELDIEKQVIPGRSIKIELNIEVKPKSKNQPQLDIIVQKEIDKKKQLISKTDQETNMEIEELDKNVLKKSEKQQNIDEKKVNEYVDDKLEGLDENKKHTFYENTPPVDKNIQVESNDENKNHTTIIGQHFECDLQSVTNSELKKNTKEDHLESNNISQEQVDKEILLEVEKALYDHKIILGQEARAKKKIQDQDIETDIETFHGEIVQEIEKLMSDDQQEEIQPNLIESINVIKQKIEELKIKIDESVQKYEDEVLKEINMTLDKTNSPVVLEKFLIDLNLLFKNQEAPFLKKLEQVYQLFPPEIFLSFEKSTEHETDIFQDFGNIYENFNEKILHTCDDEVNIDVNRVNQQKLNEEIQVANEIQHEVNINEEQVCDGNCKFYQEIKRILRERQGTNEKLQTNVKMTNSPLHFPDEKIFKGKNGDYCYVLVDFERVNQRTNDGQLQEVVKISNIGYFKKSMENYLDILKNAQEKKNGQLQFENKVKEIVDDLTQKCNDCKTNLIKAEFPVQFGVETKDIINEESDEIRQHFEEELNIKSKAYKTMKEIQQNVEEKMDVVNNFQNYESKVQDEPVVYINNSEEEIQLEDENNLLEEIQVEDTKDSFLCVRDSEEETKLETEEDFDICIDDSEEEISLMYDEEPLQYDEESEEESEMLGIVDENEVTEIIEDYISESIPSITNFSPNNEESSSTKESLSSEESSSIDKSSSTDESSSTDKEEFNSVENLSRRKDMLLRIAKLINDEHNFNGKLKYQKKKKNYGRKKIDEKPKLDPNRGENAIQEHNDHMADMFDEEYQEYYQIKEDVTRFKMDVENLMQIETFEKLQQNMDDNEIKDILNNKDFPEEIDEEVYLPNHSDILKDVIKLQCDIDELKPVFEDNIYIPLEIETDTRNQPSTTEPFNLFEKLYSIHRKKILEFVDSNTWPYNCLVPSGLLDALYDDPLEFKPNALVITLYCVDIGFSTKITKNKNELPVETFYCYKKDEILLSFIENEKLPPQLLDSLNEAEPNLFYSGCVIAEVHDLRNGTLDQIGRILLRPCNESVLKDTKNIMELFKDRDWTYESKLKLESKILLLNYSVMCGGVLPATGAAVNLQHLLLSARKLEFNPLKRKYFSSKLNTETDLVDDYNKSESTNESQISSDLMDNANDNVYYILWKFDYRLPSQSFNIFKLYVIISSLNPEFSILLYFNSKFRSITNIRFKINLETNEIKTYIMQILSVIHQKLSPDIEVIRRYKCDEKSSARSVTCIPALFDNNIYDPNYADMSQLINELLKNKSESQSNVIECNEIESPIMPINKLSGDTQNTEINSIASKQMDHTIHFRDANNLTRNSNTDINKFDIDLRRYKIPISELKMLDKKSNFHITESLLINTKFADSSTLKSPITSFDIAVDHDKMLSTKESSFISEINSDVESSLTSQMLIDSLGDTSVNINQEELGSPSCSMDAIPSVHSSTTIVLSSTINVLSSLSSPITVIASVPSCITVVSSTTSNMSSKISKKLTNHKEYDVYLDNNLKSEHYSPTMYDVMKSDPKTLLKQPISSQYEGNIPVVKHVHKNGICIKGLKTVINSKALPLKAILIQKNSSEKETTTDHQLNYNKKPLKLSDILHADPSNLQEVFKKNVPRDQVSAKRMQYIEYDDSFLQYQTLNNMKSFKVDTTPSINKMIVEDSFQETNNQPTSSDVENCKGIKRKLSTSWMEVP